MNSVQYSVSEGGADAPVAEALPYARSFYELRVYERSRALAREIFKITQRFPKDETYSLTDQWRRAARTDAENGGPAGAASLWLWLGNDLWCRQLGVNFSPETRGTHYPIQISVGTFELVVTIVSQTEICTGVRQARRTWN